MRIDILDHQANHDPFLSSIGEGFKRHGLAFDHHVGRFESDADLVVTWGITGPRRSLVEARRRAHRRTLVIERGYEGCRMTYASAGFDGLNGRADFCPLQARPERAKRLIGKLAPVREPKGRYILVIGQVESDSAVKGLHYREWVTETISRMKRAYPDLPVIFRPHPNKRASWTPKGVAICAKDLSTAMSEAYGIITLNSNVGVLAVIDGHPVIAQDCGSMVYLIAESGHHFMRLPTRPTREQWAITLASSQWSALEFASGEAWDHLRNGMYNV